MNRIFVLVTRDIYNIIYTMVLRNLLCQLALARDFPSLVVSRVMQSNEGIHVHTIQLFEDRREEERKKKIGCMSL